MPIQALRNRDKMKDDAIAQLLSDYALTARCMRLKRVAIVLDMTQKYNDNCTEELLVIMSNLN